MVKTGIPPPFSERPGNSQRLRIYVGGKSQKAEKKAEKRKSRRAENRQTEKKKGKEGPKGRTKRQEKEEKQKSRKRTRGKKPNKNAVADSDASLDGENGLFVFFESARGTRNEYEFI